MGNLKSIEAPTFEINPENLDLLNLPWMDFSLACSARGVQQLPRIPVVYFCIKRDGLPAYIGESGNLFSRWNGHHSRKNRCKEAEVVRLSWLEVVHESSVKSIQQKKRRAIEKAFMRYYLPELNHELWKCGVNTEKRRQEFEVIRNERFKGQIGHAQELLVTREFEQSIKPQIASLRSAIEEFKSKYKVTTSRELDNLMTALNQWIDR